MSYIEPIKSNDCVAIEIGCLILHGTILTLLESPSMPCITFINELTALPNVIVMLSFLEMYRVTRNLFWVRLLLLCQPVLLDPFNVLSGAIQYDKMRNELWIRSVTASLNIISYGVLTLYWSM